MLWGRGGGARRGGGNVIRFIGNYAYIHCEDIKWYDINKRIKCRYI